MYIAQGSTGNGYTLFDGYGLAQVECDTSHGLVFIYSPQNSLICALSNRNILAGNYSVDTSNLTLIPEGSL